MREIPEAFLSRMQKLLGEDYPAFLREMENAPVRALRGNPLKCAAFSAPDDVETEPLPFSGGGYIFYSDSIGRHPLHHAGAFYVQDPSAISTVAAVANFRFMRGSRRQMYPACRGASWNGIACSK